MEQSERVPDEATRQETAYRLAVGASTPIPVPDAPPSRHCDVIMKGGITSGVVYPLAGVELAARYTLKSIGGASAGAIAAGLFAAAEHRRSIGGSAKGFEDLRGYPDRFGAMVGGNVSFLQALFRPAPATRGLFRLVLASLEKKPAARIGRLLLAVLRGYPASLVGTAAGVLLVVLGIGAGNPAVRILAVAAGVVAAAVGFLVFAGLLIGWDAI